MPQPATMNRVIATTVWSKLSAAKTQLVVGGGVRRAMARARDDHVEQVHDATGGGTKAHGHFTRRANSR